MKNIQIISGIAFIIVFAFCTNTACKTKSKLSKDNISTSIDTVTAKDFFNKGSKELDLKNYQEALKYFNKSIEIDKESGETYAFRGMAKYHLKDFKGAIADYDNAIKLIPEYGEVYDQRGVAKGELGDKVGACEDWNKAYELGFNKAFKMIEKFCIEEEKK